MVGLPPEVEIAGKQQIVCPPAHGEFFGFLPVPYEVGPLPNHQGTKSNGQGWPGTNFLEEIDVAVSLGSGWNGGGRVMDSRQELLSRCDHGCSFWSRKGHMTHLPSRANHPLTIQMHRGAWGGKGFPASLTGHHGGHLVPKEIHHDGRGQQSHFTQW